MKTKILADFQICISVSLKELQRNDKLRVQGFDQGCGFAISTDDTAKTRFTSKVQRKLCKVRKEKKLQTRLILNYSAPFHHVYVAQLKFSYASYCFCNRCTTLWNIKISFRRHSAVRSL